MPVFLYCVALGLVLIAAWWDTKKHRAFERDMERQFAESKASQAELARRLNDTKHMTVNRADERTQPGEKIDVRN